MHSATANNYETQKMWSLIILHTISVLSCDYLDTPHYSIFLGHFLRCSTDQETPNSYRTLKFITVSTTAHQWTHLDSVQFSSHLHNCFSKIHFLYSSFTLCLLGSRILLSILFSYTFNILYLSNHKIQFFNFYSH